MQHPSKTTRRTFLRQVGAAGAGALAAPCVLSARAWGGDAPSKRLNIAMLATGDRSRQILPSFVKENVVAVCDVNARQVEMTMKMATEKLGEAGAAMAKAKVYDDYRKLLDAEKSVEAVVVAAGQRWHAYLSMAALKAGKHVFCEKPMAHSVLQARELRDLARESRLMTQIGSQGGASDTFRRSMEIMQAGVLGPIRESHCWINRSFPPSAPIDTHADAIPEGLNWDFWCGPSALLPFKNYYLGGCLAWGRWLEFGDGHLADMGAHGLNLPWRALNLGSAQKVSVEIHEPLKDSYPSATKFRWEFPARGDMAACTLYWHDGPKAGPPEELAKELLPTYNKVPGDGCLFAGEKGMLLSGAWGENGVVKLKGEEKFRGVNDHEACKPVARTLPRSHGHMQEWIDACKGGAPTFQGFGTAGDVAELAMVGMVALRLGKPLEWDSEALKAKGLPEADPLIRREPRKQWL